LLFAGAFSRGKPFAANFFTRSQGEAMTIHPSPRSLGRFVPGSLRQVNLRVLLLFVISLLPAVYSPGQFLQFQAVKAGFSQSAVAVVSAASYVAPVAPESIAVAFGTKLATQTVIAPADADPGLPGIQLPTELGGTTMEINGRRAGLFFVSPNQINFLVPAETTAGMATISIRGGDGTVSNGMVRIEAVAPAIFTANASGRGVPAGLLLRVLPNGQQSYEEIAQFNPVTNMIELVAIAPKTSGERLFLILFLTGVRGAADLNQSNNANETVHLLLGGEEIIPAFVGSQGIFLGLDQMNVEITPSLFGRGVVDAVINYSTLAYSNTLQIRLGGTPPPDLTVSGLSQEPLTVGQEFIINGAGFSSNANEIEVYVVAEGEPPYPIKAFSSITPTQIKAVLPFGSPSGFVRVKVRQREVASSARLKVRTSISGQVVDNSTGSPIPGVVVSASGLSTMSDRNGEYVVPDVPSGNAFVEIKASSLSLPYLAIPIIKKRVESGRDNQIETTRLTKDSGIGLPFGGSAGLLTDDESQAASQPNPRAIQTEGITFEVAGNTTAIFPGGGNAGTIFLTKVDNSRPPVRLPAGVFSSSIAQLSPFGVKLTPGGKLTFPNADNLPVNAQPKLYRLDQTIGSPTLGEFVTVGTATVSADGKTVETEVNAVLETSIFFVAIPRPLTRVQGKVVDSDGTTPVRQAAVRTRGQEVFTDSTGLFVLLDVPVRDASDLLTLEASYQRPTGRVDRVTRTGVVPVPGGVTRVTPDLKLPSVATDPNRPPTLLLPASLTVTEGTTLDTGFIASDPDAGQTITVTVTGAPFASIGLSGSAYTLRLAPDAGIAGNYTLTVRAADSGTPSLSTTQTVTVTVKVPSGNILTRTGSIPVGAQPTWTVITPNGAEVYVTNYESNTVSVINTATNAVTHTLSVVPLPFRLVISPNGARVYVGGNSGNVSVIDTATKTVSTINTLGGPVRDLAITPDGTKIYLAMEFSGLKQIVTATGVVSTVSTITCPEGVAVTPDGQTVYVNYQCFGPGGRSGYDAIGRFSVATGALLGSITGFPNGGGYMVMSPNGAQAWAYGGGNCNYTGCPFIPAGVVNAISPLSNTLIKSIGFANFAPVYTSFFPDSQLAAIGNGPELLIFDTATQSVVERVPVAASGSLAFTPDGTRAYGTVSGQNSVAVFAVGQQLKTIAGTATATANATTLLGFTAPFVGDSNNNGYAKFELGTSANGPFGTKAEEVAYIPGPQEWRADVFYPPTPNATYYVRVTYVDPDGVIGNATQIVGPVTLPATVVNTLTVGIATAVVKDTEIFVSIPARDDANFNGRAQVDIGTSANGPWTARCLNLNARQAARCRLRSLTPATDYYIRATVTDADGITGNATQIIGPLRYLGARNLALGKMITADPGWGCCPNVNELLDGLIQRGNFTYGFAWTGGNARWSGGAPGVKQATIDFGAPTTFNRATVWYHDNNNVPIIWNFQSSNDGVTWTNAYSNTVPICRTETIQMPGNWGFPACGHDARFASVTARYFRYTFDDRTLFDGIHGWAVEVEVFNAP